MKEDPKCGERRNCASPSYSRLHQRLHHGLDSAQTIASAVAKYFYCKLHREELRGYPRTARRAIPSPKPIFSGELLSAAAYEDGHTKAITAAAHKLARIVFHLLSTRQSYEEAFKIYDSKTGKEYTPAEKDALTEDERNELTTKPVAGAEIGTLLNTAIELRGLLGPGEISDRIKRVGFNSDKIGKHEIPL